MEKKIALMEAISFMIRFLTNYKDLANSRIKDSETAQAIRSKKVGILFENSTKVNN